MTVVHCVVHCCISRDPLLIKELRERYEAAARLPEKKEARKRVKQERLPWSEDVKHTMLSKFYNVYIALLSLSSPLYIPREQLLDDVCGVS